MLIWFVRSGPMLSPKVRSFLEPQIGKTICDAIDRDFHLGPVYGMRFHSMRKIEDEIPGKPSTINESLWIPSHYKYWVTHPLNHAGAFYLQDPAASLPVYYLDVKPSDIVLDMCAAPGGKSLSILEKNHDGYLIANELDSKRNVKLTENLSRWGYDHFTVIQEDGMNLGKYFRNQCDKVLCDAPCSGEGMYRRKPDHMASFSIQTVDLFKDIQIGLLNAAYECCVDGGVIMYATCTLNTIENEGVLQTFFDTHPECSLIPIEHPLKYDGLLGFKGACRFVPSAHSEGQFFAKIHVRKEDTRQDLRYTKGLEMTSKQQIHYMHSKPSFFLKTKAQVTLPGIACFEEKGTKHVMIHESAFHPLLTPEIPSYAVDLETAYRYLFGHPLESSTKGFVRIEYKGLILGYAKGTGLVLNNKYPKHL